jgi:hypothetical protein
MVTEPEPDLLHVTTNNARAATADRYRSFKGIDFDGQSDRMMARIQLHTQNTDNKFWPYFFQRRSATKGMRCDDLLLLASFVNPIRELLEERDDELGLEWLDQLERECF